MSVTEKELMSLTLRWNSKNSKFDTLKLNPSTFKSNLNNKNKSRHEHETIDKKFIQNANKLTSARNVNNYLNNVNSKLLLSNS